MKVLEFAKNATEVPPIYNDNSLQQLENTPPSILVQTGRFTVSRLGQLINALYSIVVQAGKLTIVRLEQLLNA